MESGVPKELLKEAIKFLLIYFLLTSSVVALIIILQQKKCDGGWKNNDFEGGKNK